ncbi:DUF1573 domain-containing protein [Polaribacter vadi]|uniref:DUF1573 domain-containing protein n=1 Tax=Polaribacter TaxID=52959 RepID=UPI001C08D1C2|nr:MULTISPECIES: DUF1573 domain-containing protein [Polaribacter]MBU3009946.1 DUF1573 domain-containing protein [Polaribacter vadi]MDO6739752.1 DUF1573 domain-containing protein [Polaribacter sp. 1_MG-2023]
MHKGFIFLLIFFLSLKVSAQEFEFKKEIINYGKIKKGENGKRIFEFTNIGNAPLIIKDIKTSCDCAIPEKPKKPIMPGEKMKLTVEYDTSKLGGFSKEIIIFSNAKEAIKRIKIKGYISK